MPLRALLLATLATSSVVAAPAASPEAVRRSSIVVLDPGHGGSNAGTHGLGNAPSANRARNDVLHEKELTLTLSNLVADRLRAKGVTVELTRTGDRTLTLRQRVARADELAADIFVSIHANASPTRTQRGFETFILTPRGVTVDARALRGDTHTARPGIEPEIAAVLDDVERGSTAWESADLAARMQRSLRETRGAANDRGVRQDAHHVLLGATMPAVLVEVGFLDHPIEGKQLAESETQAQIADALAAAILEQLEDQ